MSTYCTVLITLSAFATILHLAMGKADKAGGQVVGLLIYLPIFGRIFGWW